MVVSEYRPHREIGGVFLCSDEPYREYVLWYKTGNTGVRGIPFPVLFLMKVDRQIWKQK
jgi:hypothetical protein